MRVLMITSEAVPYAKTGGLADVCGALPRALEARGHEVRLVMPRYRRIDRDSLEPGPYPLGVPTGSGERWCLILSTTMPRSGVTLSFVEHDALFDRRGLYGPSGGEDYPDNCLRFTVLCRAALQLCHHLQWFPDVIHCHDWQAALTPWLIDAFEKDTPLANTPTLLTIHNLAYQGRFGANELMQTGLTWEHFDWKGLEFYGDLNLLKGGIAKATLINTVSPTYAEEIQTPEHGEGLESLLQQRSDDLFGVLNGIDDEYWDPAQDALLPARYDAKDRSGKATCREALCRRAGLDPRTDRLLAGFIGRLAPQKGADLLLEAAERLLAEGLQLIVLGTGEPGLEERLASLVTQYPGQVAVWIEFSEELAHLIYAGSDLLLMPSLYEPCGLNQLYALRYGTLPIVSPVGGLRDSVIDADQRDGTGFLMTTPSADELVASAARAVQIARKEPARFRALIVRAMEQRFSWDRAALRYEELYDDAVQRVHPRPTIPAHPETGR